jgi:fumarate reductase subunit D
MPKQTATKKTSSNKDIEENMYVAALSYLAVLCLIPLFLKRDSSFAQSHASQGLVLFIAEIAGMFIYWFPLIGQLLFFSFIIASAYGIMVTLRGEEWEIPIIGKYANKLNL